MVAIKLNERQAADLVDGEPFELRTPDGRRCVAVFKEEPTQRPTAGGERIPEYVLREVVEAMERRERGEGGPMLTTQEVFAKLKSGDFGPNR